MHGSTGSFECVLLMTAFSKHHYDALQGFKQVRIAQYVSTALAAVLAFGLAAALGQGIAPLSRVSASLVAGKLFKPRAVGRIGRNSLSCRANASQQAMLSKNIPRSFFVRQMSGPGIGISASCHLPLRRHCSHGYYHAHKSAMACRHGGMRRSIVGIAEACHRICSC